MIHMAITSAIISNNMVTTSTIMLAITSANTFNFGLNLPKLSKLTKKW